MLIGLIDSGNGGLAVLDSIKDLNHSYILIMDKAFFPYGVKSKEFLLKRSYYLVNYLVKRKCDLIIIACNTLSIMCSEFLKTCFKVKIISIFDCIKDELKNGNIFIGTKNSCIYVSEKYKIDCIDGTKLIWAIENKKDYQNIIDSLLNVKNKKLVLGCTHFLAINSNFFPVETINPIFKLRLYLND